MFEHVKRRSIGIDLRSAVRLFAEFEIRNEQQLRTRNIEFTKYIYSMIMCWI